MFKMINQQGQNINNVLAKNQKNLEALKASGNGQEQRREAVPAQAQQPQAQSQGAAASGPFETNTQQQRPRSFSEAVSGTRARQTVRQSLVQQASTGAQITAMSEEKWLEAMQKAFGMSSASPIPAESRSRSQSLNSPPSGVRFNLDN